MQASLFNFMVSLIRNPFRGLKELLCKIRSIRYSRLIDKGKGRIILTDPFLKVSINKAKGSQIFLNADLRIIPHLGGTSPVRINIGENATLQIDGDFIIGNGVKIHIEKNATLYIGGKENESNSGITCDVLIMVFNRISIGKDFICAWDVFISDSDWHQISNKSHHSDVIIGDHVWIANSCSILKGSKIGSGCVVASHSKVSGKEFLSNSMIAGIPAKLVSTNINWTRDI